MRDVKSVAVLAAAVLCYAGFTAARAQDDDPLAIHEVTDGLYVIPGFDGGVSGGNVAVRVTDEGVVIVDDKFPHSFQMITDEVAKVTPQPIRYVLNTHHHGDHAGSNADFMRAAEVIAHTNARANMVRNEQDGAPRIVFSDETAVNLGGVEVQARHVGRGHTNGDAVVYFPDLRAIHTGDLFIWGERGDGSILTPFFDYGNGGSAVDWPATLDAVLELDFDTVIPGHGPILTKDEVHQFKRNFETMLTRARGLIGDGATRVSLFDRLQTDDLGWPFGRGRIESLYDELTQ